MPFHHRRDRGAGSEWSIVLDAYTVTGARLGMKRSWLNRVVPATKADIERIIMTQAEELASIKSLTVQLGKSHDEIVAKLKALQDTIDNNPVSPEVAAAVGELTTAVQNQDDIIPDGPPPIVPPVP